MLKAYFELSKDVALGVIVMDAEDIKLWNPTTKQWVDVVNDPEVLKQCMIVENTKLFHDTYIVQLSEADTTTWKRHKYGIIPVDSTNVQKIGKIFWAEPETPGVPPKIEVNGQAFFNTPVV